jgi:hypothetical protein
LGLAEPKTSLSTYSSSMAQKHDPINKKFISLPLWQMNELGNTLHLIQWLLAAKEFQMANHAKKIHVNPYSFQYISMSTNSLLNMACHRIDYDL